MRQNYLPIRFAKALNNKKILKGRNPTTHTHKILKFYISTTHKTRVKFVKKILLCHEKGSLSPSFPSPLMHTERGGGNA